MWNGKSGELLRGPGLLKSDEGHDTLTVQGGQENLCLTTAGTIQLGLSTITGEKAER